MVIKEKLKLILTYLESLFPNPRCELNYEKDYELLLAVMLSAQTTDKRVNLVTGPLFKKYPSLLELNKLSEEDIKEYIRSVGTFNIKAKNFKSIVQNLIENNSIVPNDRTYLESLPGVGRKTASVVLSNIYNVPCIAVDTHVERLSKRLGLVSEKLNANQVSDKLEKIIPKNKQISFHHQMVLFGRYKCTARNPSCEECGLKDICKYYKNR